MESAAAAHATARTTRRLGPKLRLGLLIAVLATGFVVFGALDVVSKEDVRGVVEPFGIAAPIVFVPLSALLSTVFIPGAVLAAVSGLLFGPVVGTVVALAAAVASGCTQVVLARVAARDAVTELSGPTVQRLEAALDRHGTLAVAGQRLMPGVPDAPCSYAFGLLGVSLRSMAVGTALGSAPRAFAYAVLGSSYDDLSSPLAIAALAVIALAGLTGVLLGHRAYLSERRRRRIVGARTDQPFP